ncbi:porin [Mesorhizobium sp. L-8-10]|uniref:porin n=1 Tax=unclassified Mesorhizobium TaxID=325217 RepID=UPI0019267DB0|nr:MULTISPECIES: porin [unclassified Mesorhizobium]BCH20914.1 porin [Mesorhizobium sp. L-8-3]BCH28740.1 porin [Mesorhizobium sp. L-8-10]
MKLKSLLLGSAAAMVAVTGARAADAVVVAEPEPVEYVRVCDTFGTGYFYIPGTETCLRISGYVRYRVGATNDDGFDFDAEGNPVGDTPNFNGFIGGGWNKSTRARVNFDARSQTEWGTLQAFIRFQADWGQASVTRNPFADGPVSTDQAWLSLGGFRAGYTQSAWAETIHGVTNGGSFSDGALWYGDQQRHLLQYNFGGDTGLFAVASLEDDALQGNGYVPDAVGVIGYQQGWGAVWARVGYDNSIDPEIDGDDDAGFGAQLATQINIPNTQNAIRLMGWYANNDTVYGTQSPYAGVSGGNGAAEWSVLAAYNHTFTEKFSASTGFQYFNNFYEAYSDVKTGLDGYSADLSFVYEPVQNFEIRNEWNYDKVDGLDGSVSGWMWFLRRF